MTEETMAPENIGHPEEGGNWRYILTLLGAAVISALLAVGYESGVFGALLHPAPRIVLLNEVRIYQSLQRFDPKSATSPKEAERAAQYVGKVIETTIDHYRRKGVAVVLGDSVIVLPKRDDITPAVEAVIERHFEKGKG